MEKALTQHIIKKSPGMKWGNDWWIDRHFPFNEWYV